MKAVHFRIGSVPGLIITTLHYACYACDTKSVAHIVGPLSIDLAITVGYVIYMCMIRINLRRVYIRDARC